MACCATVRRDSDHGINRQNPRDARSRSTARNRAPAGPKVFKRSPKTGDAEPSRCSQVRRRSESVGRSPRGGSWTGVTGFRFAAAGKAWAAHASVTGAGCGDYSWRSDTFLRPGAVFVRAWGKGGHPFPVPLKTYDETLTVLRRSLASARVGNQERIEAIRRLDRFVRTVERQFEPTAEFETTLTHERSLSSSLEGRSTAARVSNTQTEQLRLGLG